MNTLIIKNDICELLLESESINKILWESLRFRDKNYFFAPKRKGWDGYTDFYTKNGKFCTGLLPEIVNVLHKLKVNINIDDQRSKELPYKEITEDILENIQLRDYQIELGNKAWKTERCIIKAATAAGKTLLFSSMLKAIPEKTPVLVLFRNKTLVNQTYRIFKKNGIKNIGIAHGEEFDPNFILCATIQSAHKYEELLDKFKVLIVDECQEFATNKSIRVFKKMKNCRYRFGFSATPWEPGDNLKKYKLKSWFGPVIGDINTKFLQEQGILAQSNCKFHTIDEPIHDSNNYRDVYDQGVIYNSYLHKKIKEIVDSYDSGRIIIVVERLQHGEELKKLIPNALWVKGDDDEESRKIVIDQLCKSESNEKVVVIATKIFSVGIDLFVHVVINAAGFKSHIMTLQRLGRGLRKAPDKDVLDYHDFYFKTNSHLENHSIQRMKHLKKEGHIIEIL